MIKRWCWLKFYFWLFFLSKQCKSVTLKCIGLPTFDLEYFSNLIAITCFSLYFVICMRLATKYEKINLYQRGPFLALNARSPFRIITIILGAQSLCLFFPYFIPADLPDLVVICLIFHTFLGKMFQYLNVLTWVRFCKKINNGVIF